MKRQQIIKLTNQGRFLKLITNNATFRIRKAKQYPGDDRNINSSTALFALYKYCENLSSDHPVFSKFDSMNEDQLEDLNSVLSRYGFCRDDEEIPTPEKFISEI
jgi:hypothetical protein